MIVFQSIVAFLLVVILIINCLDILSVVREGGKELLRKPVTELVFVTIVLLVLYLAGTFSTLVGTPWSNA